MAPVAPSGLVGASKDTNHVSPRASWAVNPAAKPLDFSRMTVHDASSGGAATFGPVTSSSADSPRVPIRLVNQLESGTSSMLLTLPASRSVKGRREVTK